MEMPLERLFIYEKMKVFENFTDIKLEFKM
jgi:hypothetical protein